MRRLPVVGLAILLAACSQRAEWRVAPAPPAAAAENTRTTANAGRESSPTPGDGRDELEGIALAGVARLPAPDPGASIALHFPVAGIDASKLKDSYDDPRDGNRRHAALDIMAPRGTPVLSVQDGRVIRLATSARGGIALYTTDPDEKFVFYYAHLERYHGLVHAGMRIQRGDTLGYVGTTGNAPKNVPHLHFQMMRMPRDRSRYWDGEPMNPYPYLRRAGH